MKILCVVLSVAFLTVSAAPAQAKTRKPPYLTYGKAYAAALDRANREQLANTLLYGGYQVEGCNRIARNKFGCIVDFWGVKPGSTFPDPPYRYWHLDCQVPVLVALGRFRVYPNATVQPGGKCVTYSNSSTQSSNFP